ncbi:hypothetical protein [Microbacterium sp.]|uniref:hypothetical protein n=1 Tax=Microbacterium sp. TaxID=51671 RepID=UPI003A8DFB62
MSTLLASNYESLADLPAGVLPTALAVGVALIALHAWLSRRNPAWLGAAVPVLYIALAVVLSVLVRPTTGMLVGHGACLLALLVIWWAGSDTRKKKREPAPVDA